VMVATGVAATLNFAIGAVALRIAPAQERFASGQPDVVASAGGRAAGRSVYAVAALSGMTALGAQVVWTRLLALLFGATTYTFATSLAVSLGGLGLGSLVAAAALRRGHDSRELLAASQLALVAALVYAAGMIAKVIPYTSPMRVTPIEVVHALQA